MGIESGSFAMGSSEGTPVVDAKKQLCLKALLYEAFSPEYDRDQSPNVGATIERSITVGNDDEGRWMLGCLEEGCDARCIMVMGGLEGEESMFIPDQRSLDLCNEDN